MSRVRIGVVGCGAIAQVQHLPFLAELSEEFEVAAVCDASPSQAAYAARQFGVERQFTDYREMLASDIDAVLLCHSDPKTEAVIASVDGGQARLRREADLLLARRGGRDHRSVRPVRQSRPGRIYQAVRAGLRAREAGGRRDRRRPVRPGQPPAP